MMNFMFLHLCNYICSSYWYRPYTHPGYFFTPSLACTIDTFWWQQLNSYLSFFYYPYSPFSCSSQRDENVNQIMSLPYWKPYIQAYTHLCSARSNVICILPSSNACQLPISLRHPLSASGPLHQLFFSPLNVLSKVFWLLFSSRFQLRCHCPSEAFSFFPSPHDYRSPSVTFSSQHLFNIWN